MTAAWWEHLAELLDEAAEYLADHELSTAGYLSRAAWMARAIGEDEAAGEQWRQQFRAWWAYIAREVAAGFPLTVLGILATITDQPLSCSTLALYRGKVTVFA